MRADRLVSALLVLQARGRVTAAELAAELEVSVATARRDLVAMSSAGIPVYAQPGRGGGWQLIGGAWTDLSGLTATEAQALFRLAGPAVSASPEARDALRKLVQAMPEPFREPARSAAQSTVLDPEAWGRDPASTPPLVALLQDAVVARVRVELCYRDRTGAFTERSVDPWGLIDKDGTWYLVAGTDRGRRTFRVDRIAQARTTEEPAERPADLDLEREWDEVRTEIEARRSGVSATLSVPRRHLPVLRAQFGRVEVDGSAAEVAASSALDLARRLAGWGSLLKVRSPKRVRELLAEIGADLVAAYQRSE